MVTPLFEVNYCEPSSASWSTTELRHFLQQVIVWFSQSDLWKHRNRPWLHVSVCQRAHLWYFFPCTSMYRKGRCETPESLVACQALQGERADCWMVELVNSCKVWCVLQNKLILPQSTCLVYLQLGVSKNRGTPKWMVYNGKPYQNGWFGGTTIFGNTQLSWIY